MIYSDVFIDVTKLAKKLPTSDYHETGKYPIIDQGQKQIAGYTDLEERLFTDVPAIIFGDHTRVIKYVDTPFFIGADGVKVIKSLDEDSDYKYLYYLLSSVRIPNTGYNRHYKWLKEAILPEHNKQQQEQIVKTLTVLDDLIDKYNAQTIKLDELIKSRFVEMFDSLNNYTAFSDLCTIITDGTHQPPKFVEEGIPFLFVSNIVTNSINYEAEKFISEDTYNELYKRTPIEIGDIIMSTVGSYGHPAVVTSNKKFLFQRHIAYLKPKKEIINPLFLHSAILSEKVQEQIERRVKGIAQKTLNLSEIKQLRIPLPDLHIQNQFADFVTQVDKTKSGVKQSIEKLETLKKSLMQEYFG